MSIGQPMSEQLRKFSTALEISDDPPVPMPDHFDDIPLYIDSDEKLANFVATLPSPEGAACALDTEADSLHCYQEKLCLIQFLCQDHVALIDTLSITSFQPLLDWLARCDLWMHGADFDIRMMRRTFGWVPEIIFDTQIAARLLGHRKFGLANLVEDFCGVTLSKQSQKADWGQRPLPQKMLTYAINDVRYLIPMGRFFEKELRRLERWDWFLESCRHAITSISPQVDRNTKEDGWQINGWGRMKTSSLVFLRELWAWRDEEARRRDRPPFKVLGNDRLKEAAESLADGRSVAIPSRLGRSALLGFEKAIDFAKSLPESEWPDVPKRKRVARDPDFESRVAALRKHRDELAAQLDLDPSLIASRAVLEQIATDSSKAADLLMGWQKLILNLP